MSAAPVMTMLSLAERAKRPLEDETARDISGNPRGSIDDASGKDILSEFGRETEHPQRFVGRFTKGRR
jgi:hypothetical protein